MRAVTSYIGAQDGQSDCPVVSISLGNSCDFLYRDFDNNNDDGMGSKKLQLNSGDILLFGGPSRHIQHSVSSIHMNTCPQQLQDLHLEKVKGTTHMPGVPSESFVQHPPHSFRLNLTYRHAPELFGKENEERFCSMMLLICNVILCIHN